MMYVKAYSYHIKMNKEEELLQIHQKSASIYKKYIDCQSIVLKSQYDETKWVEIHLYEDKETYSEAIKLINNKEDIQKLYKAFENLLSSEITEEDFTQIGTSLKPSCL